MRYNIIKKNRSSKKFFLQKSDSGEAPLALHLTAEDVMCFQNQTLLTETEGAFELYFQSARAKLFLWLFLNAFSA